MAEPGIRRPLVALALASLYAVGATLVAGRSTRTGRGPERPREGGGASSGRPVPDGRTAERGPASDSEAGSAGGGSDVAPGDDHTRDGETSHGLSTYAIGLALASILTVASLYVTGTTLIWGPGIPLALIVLAIAQMGVHLVFFLHIDTSPDSTNNVMALAFGVLIVILVVAGSLWIMANLNSNMMPMDQIMKMQR